MCKRKVKICLKYITNKLFVFKKFEFVRENLYYVHVFINFSYTCYKLL